MCYNPVASVKFEHRVLNDKLWLSTGINYSNINLSMSKYGSSQEDNYFYIVLNQEQENNEVYYYTIKEIKETNHYAGIPVDIKYSPFSSRLFRIYFKMEFCVNYQLSSKRNVVFYEPEMEKYETEILDLFNQSKSIYFTESIGAGLQIGKSDKPKLRLEIHYPAFISSDKSFSLMDLTFGGGFNCSFVLPLKN
jgi:hypothetical protein